MTQAGKHRSSTKVPQRPARTSRTKMNASLAMVVCFVGFQGIVPQSWETAAAVSPDYTRTSSAFFSDDGTLPPTGFVGTSLLAPFDRVDVLDATQPPVVGPPTTGDEDTAKDAAASGATNRPSAGHLFTPLDELIPTSSFGFRTSPITGEAGEFHTGQDYAAPCGTPVYSVDAGTVRAVGWHQWGGGNRVEVDHGNGLITSYNHLQGISVAVGDAVDGGQSIAAVGTSGSSTGCHLHFETILDGEHVDPLRWELVPTGHGASQGGLTDYTPGGGGSGALPAWAQSVTRSDQPAPGPDGTPSTSDAGAWPDQGSLLPWAPGLTVPETWKPTRGHGASESGTGLRADASGAHTPPRPADRVPAPSAAPTPQTGSGTAAPQVTRPTTPAPPSTPAPSATPKPPTPSPTPKPPTPEVKPAPTAKPEPAPIPSATPKPPTPSPAPKPPTPEVKPAPTAKPEPAPIPSATPKPPVPEVKPKPPVPDVEVPTVDPEPVPTQPGTTVPDPAGPDCDTDPTTTDPTSTLPGGTPAPGTASAPEPPATVPSAAAAEAAATSAHTDTAGVGSPEDSDPTRPSCGDEDEPDTATDPAPADGAPGAPAPAQPTEGLAVPPRDRG